MYGPG
ncbi:hypothetical protein YPPY100_4122, partial [Yersinia pestis PY-100]